MSDQDNTDGKRPLGLKSGGPRSPGTRKPSVVVEKKRKRITLPTDAAPAPKRTVHGAKPTADKAEPQKPIIQVKKRPAADKPAAVRRPDTTPKADDGGRRLKTLTEDERQARQKALAGARAAEGERQKRVAAERLIEEADAAKRAVTQARDAKKQAEEDAKRNADLETRQKTEAEAAKKLEEEERVKAEAKAKAEAEKEKKIAAKGGKGGKGAKGAPEQPAEDDGYDKRRAPPTTFRVKQTRANEETRATKAPVADRRKGKLTINQALNEDGGQRERSLASIKRRREREKRQLQKLRERGDKIAREVVVPDVITVTELANRMAERAAVVVKTLLDLGVMATVNQSIDADTAQLVVEEMGHKPVRRSASDVEDGLTGEVHDDEADLQPRAPVVTVMGHVDHGKTSLLDAFRKTNVVSGEAGGITQHIGAYQVDVGGSKITFLDTPGHAAFTQMRARGAKVTDLVIVVVASDDGVMPQTIEAINHAKAAGVPLIVAVNKCDLPDGNPDRVKQELLQHDVYVEDLGGEIMAVNVSATKGTGLEGLLESIALQAEILELKANPNRPAQGAVIEAQLDKGRGPVATVLVQHGTLKVGDVFVAGSEWGRVRALVNDKGEQVKEAGPSIPVEVLGLQGAPSAGDEFVVVENEARAREVAEYREEKAKEEEAAKGGASFEQMFAKLQADDIAEVPVVIKADVQGSVEAIQGALESLNTDEVAARILHAGVGGVTEHDISLAAASGAVVIGFNVRANPQARNAAKAENIEIRYYSVIYNLVDDVKAAMSGLLKPTINETFLGRAEVREIFAVSKVGKVAGCLITEGVARAKSRARVLRDDIVVHEGKLDALRRFKDEAKEVQAGTECGMSLENYQDVKKGDVIELYESEEIARTL